jgi:CRISPR-associated protein Cas6
MPYVDLAFRLTGSKVPVDHGYALYSAISRLLPQIHEAKNIGVHPIRGTREQTVSDTFLPAEWTDSLVGIDKNDDASTIHL